MEALEYPDRYVRDVALRTLVDMGPRAKTAVPAIIGIFAAEKPDPRVSVRIWRNGEPALKDDHRSDVVSALRKIGATDFLVGALKHKNPDVREGAVRTLGEMHEEKAKVLPLLVEALKSLSEIGLHPFTDNEVKAVLPALVELLKEDNIDVNVTAVRALGRMGKQGVPYLLDVLKHKDKDVRANAVSVLGWKRMTEERAITALIGAVKDEHAEVREQAVEALGRFGPAGEKALLGWSQTAEKRVIDALIAALKDDHKEVREQAVAALGNFGQAAEKAIPALAEMMRKEPNRAGYWCASALSKMGPKTVPTAIELLQDENEEVRNYALYIFGRMKSTAKAAIPELIRLLKSEQHREDALWALTEIGPESEKALPGLREMMKDVKSVAPNCRRFAFPKPNKQKHVPREKSVNPDSREKTDNSDTPTAPRQSGAFTHIALPRETEMVVSAASISPDDKLLAVGLRDRGNNRTRFNLMLYNLASGELLHYGNAHDEGVDFVEFLPEKNRLLTSGGGAINIWDVGDTKDVRLVVSHKKTGGCVALSVDGKLLLTHDLKLLDVQTGHPIRTFEGQVGTSYAFSPNNKMIVASDRPGSGVLQLWNVESGKVIFSSEESQKWSFPSTFSPDGKYVVTTKCGLGHEKHTTHYNLVIWEVLTGKEIRISSRHSGQRSLVPSHCRRRTIMGQQPH